MKTITKLFRNNLLPIVLLVSCLSFGQSLATYTITFSGTWNATDHTQGSIMFPPNDHWSDLVGATHNSSITFWEAGQLASTGIENVAELGSNAAFNSEVNSAITARNADQWLQQAFETPNMAASSSTLMSITVSEDFPLLTLVTMIAPSPDWFAGVHDVSLRNGDNWESSINIDVFPYDAGTEDGTSYTSSNAASNPQQNITNITNINPFNNQKVGTLTITLESVLSTPNNDFKSGVYLSPNPSKGIVFINNTTSETIKNIIVYDVIGKLVKTITTQSLNTKTQLNFENLNSGIYLVKVNSTKGNFSLKKLIIE